MRRPSFKSFALVFFFVALAAATAATTIPMRYENGMIWVKVTAAGRSDPLDFLFDSGASASALDAGTGRTLGLTLGRPQSVQGVGARSIGYEVDDFAGKMSGVELPKKMLAVDLSVPSSACRHRIDGLLGMDFIRGRIIQVDYGAQVLRLLERGELSEAGCEILPLAMRNGAPCLEVSIEGGGPEWLRLDTGCNTALEWVVSDERAKTLRRAAAAANSGSVHELFTRVGLGSLRIIGVRTGICAKPMFAGECGLVGNGLLAPYVVTIDAERRRVLIVGEKKLAAKGPAAARAG